MIIEAFFELSLIKIDQRLCNSASGTRKTGQHFERTQRLRRFEMVIGIVFH